jgi:hypothetical protein
MRPIIRSFILAAVSASATTAFAFDRVTVNVPFNFEAHGKTLPAGTYKVESASNHYALTLSSNTDTNVSLTWIASPAEFGPNKSTLSLRFDIGADGTHALRSIRLGTLITPVLDVPERHVPQHAVSISDGR